MLYRITAAAGNLTGREPRRRVMYVIKKKGFYEFATPPGSARSYTRDLNKAAVYRTKEAALASGPCGNEVVVPIEAFVELQEVRHEG